MMNTHAAIEKFNGQGFHTWQMKIKFHLMKYNLWNLVKGTSSSNEREKEPQRLEQAFAIIALGLGDNYLHHIANLEDPAEAWAVLDHLFGASSKHSKLSLKIEFFELELTSGAPLDAHINKMRSLMNQLASVDSPVRDDRR